MQNRTAGQALQIAMFGFPLRVAHNFRRSVPRAIRRVLTAPEVFFLMRAGANSAERIMAVP